MKFVNEKTNEEVLETTSRDRTMAILQVLLSGGEVKDEGRGTRYTLAKPSLFALTKRNSNRIRLLISVKEVF